MDESVKVAVRVRPFNQRELKANPQCIISMSGQVTTISHPSDGSKKTFSFDHSYWSHDGFKVGENGVSAADPQNSNYADQMKVFNDLGRGVLDNAWEGYNATLFAYGQTGSGKSYSMIGYSANRGIVPITCSELFRAVEKNDGSKKEFQVTFSMLEIYNEQVRDLLLSTRGNKGPGPRARAGLKVRQRPGQGGFYCEGLKQVPVQNYVDIERLMDEGVVNRTTASTSMNATSSRSHMVITIGFKQVFPNEQGQSTTKTSEVSLVDLAGSERAASTEATGDRLKEGSAINTSLLTLGNVIHALAESSTGKRKVNVPYRDSVLTKLLMSALGGNSKTIMIAALSPAAINYEETLSTLRYADRAKQIKTRAIVNEGLTEKLIRELRAENKKLLDQLKQMGLGGEGLTAVKALDVQKLLQENQRQMAEQEMSWQNRLEQARRDWEESQKVTSVEMPATWGRTPYITNVNEDPQLSGVIRFPIVKGDSLLGIPGAASVTIEMRGLGIQKHHAIISNSGSDVSISPGSKQASITVNGKALSKGKAKLKHLDRIKLGSNNLYLYVGFPDDRVVGERPLEVYTHDVFQAELAEEAGFSGRTTDGEQVDPELLAVFEEYISLLPRILEVNAMSNALGKELTFELEVKNLATHDGRGRAKDKQILVRLTSKANKVWVWSKEKFMNRKYMMEDMYNRWLDGDQVSTDQTNDPFWDPLEDIFIGSVHVWLTGLAYCMEADDHLEVRNYHGKTVGKLHVKLTPSDVTGQALLEEMLILDPGELLGCRLDFLISIPEGATIKWTMADPSRGTFCRFTFYKETDVMQTQAVLGKANPRYAFSKQLTVSRIDKDFLAYLQTNALVIEVWGTQASADSLGGTSVAIQRAVVDSEPETVILFLQEKLQRQEQELTSLRRAQALLNQENARLQRSSVSANQHHRDARRRKSLIDDVQPLLARRTNADQSRNSISGARRKVGVFLPTVTGLPLRPSSRSDTPGSPPPSQSVTIIDFNSGREPRPSVTHITPGARLQRRRSSISISPPSGSPIPGHLAQTTSPPRVPSPLLPSNPGSHTLWRQSSVSPSSPITAQPPVTSLPGQGTQPVRSQQAVAAPGSDAKDSVDVELVKALKVFFKDMKDVQRRTKELRKLGEEDREAGDNGHLKAAATRQQEALIELETDVNSNLTGLKDVVLSIIRRRRDET